MHALINNKEIVKAPHDRPLVWEIHRWLVDDLLEKRPVKRTMFPRHDVITSQSYWMPGQHKDAGLPIWKFPLSWYDDLSTVLSAQWEFP